jgi:peroxiredoxin
MAARTSTMLPLGTEAPHFSLPDTRGRTVSIHDYDESKGLLVMFICNHCPYVKHLRGALADFASEYGPKGLGIVAISSNDVERYPADAPDQMAREAKEAGYSFPYLYDETQEVAKAYRAACTPDFFLFDGDRQLVYRGQFDDSRPGNDRPVTGRDLRAAADAALTGKPVEGEQTPSIGCGIKWKPGNAPEYEGA